MARTKLSRTTGLSALRSELRRRKMKAAEGFEVGARMAATQTLRKSNYYVPIDTRALKDTGKVVKEGSGLNTQIAIVYGGPDVEYAVIVHEDESKAHGFTFNFIHAAEIAAGLTHKRRPQESTQFLTKGIQETRELTRNIIYREVRKRQGK